MIKISEIKALIILIKLKLKTKLFQFLGFKSCDIVHDYELLTHGVKYKFFSIKPINAWYIHICLKCGHTRKLIYKS